MIELGYKQIVKSYIGCCPSHCPTRWGGGCGQFGKGQMGSALTGSLQIPCFFLFLKRDLLGTPVNLLLPSQKCQGVPFSPICQNVLLLQRPHQCRPHLSATNTCMPSCPTWLHAYTPYTWIHAYMHTRTAHTHARPQPKFAKSQVEGLETHVQTCSKSKYNTVVHIYIHEEREREREREK